MAILGGLAGQSLHTLTKFIRNLVEVWAWSERCLKRLNQPFYLLAPAKVASRNVKSVRESEDNRLFEDFVSDIDFLF